MSLQAPDPTPVNTALRRLHRGVLITLAVCALVIAASGQTERHGEPPAPDNPYGVVALALAAGAILSRRSVATPSRPTRGFVYASVASLVCAGGLGLLGVAAGSDGGHTSTGLLYALAGALLSLRPPPTIALGDTTPEG